MVEEKVSDLTTEQKARQEGQKLLYDTCKHLTTLNTGSILILATFLEKLFIQDREWTYLVAVVFLALIISMISSVATMLALSSNVFYLRDATETVYRQRVRSRHDLEQRIRELEGRPRSEGRERLIARLKKRLEQG